MNPAGKVRCNMRKQIELGRDDCNSAEPGDKCGVDQFAMTGRPAVEHDRRPKSRSVAPHTGGAPRIKSHDAARAAAARLFGKVTVPARLAGVMGAGAACAAGTCEEVVPRENRQR